ncbi:MAG: 2-oxoglutarate dehydrogenase complex dihydrolipoyllysine-residue succinyltransferase [Bdellovibrionales bacterium]|nr:2-oxoglutarate dehydrogenase complex dihydrolipoyllysine-residue succinyltransferase [Bdellovibrionales bacterium]
MKAEVKVPAVGESITEATIAEWNKQNGDYVERDEVLLTLETDKASVEVVAEQAGVLNIQIQEGETIDIGTVIATIDTDASAPAGASKTESAPSPSANNAPPSPTASSDKSIHPDLKNHLSPAVNKLVHEKGLNPQSIEGTGKDGRLTKADAMNAQAAPKAEAKPAPQMTSLPTPSFGAPEQSSERKPMSTLRKKIAERLVSAQQTAAILTTFNEVDMSHLMKLRKQYKDQFKEKHDVNLGFMGFFVKACIEALKTFPAVNAFIDGNDMIYNHFHNVGIAVGTPKGLMVPVIKNADYLSLSQIEQSIRHYALKARDGKISIDDLSGGTFTISNGGVYGSLMSTPILNPPQSAILGMHKIEERPVVIDGKIEIRPMMYLALSYDHRVIDGAESVQFLVRIKECIEDPTRLLLEV